MSNRVHYTLRVTYDEDTPFAVETADNGKTKTVYFTNLQTAQDWINVAAGTIYTKFNFEGGAIK